MQSTWCLLVAALVAGCASLDDTTGGLMPQSHEDKTAHPKDPAMTLAGNMTTCPDGVCVRAIATNSGSKTYHASSVCVTPWTEEMQRAGSAVQHREPMAYCAAFGLSPFPPGATQTYEASWNMTLWRDSTSSYAPAPAGTYSWRIGFTLYASSGGEGSQTLWLEFPVIVGST